MESPAASVRAMKCNSVTKWIEYILFELNLQTIADREERNWMVLLASVPCIERSKLRCNVTYAA